MTLDPEAMTRLLEITGGDQAFVDELIDTFIEDATSQIEALRSAAAAGDGEAIVRPAHSLKSNAANVGAALLGDLARSLETDGRTGDVPDAVGRVASVEAEFDAVRDALLAQRAAR
jgi:two-component system, sensor histidine kinase and response regulator